jgi:methionine-S-sulfoxide reductase
MDDPGRYQRATFAAGCFWDVEAAFRRVSGIVATVVGYTGGTLEDPDYGQVGRGKSGHAEAVDIMFDPEIFSYEDLLARFWEIHDPTLHGHQGDYTGPQYRSAIYFHTPQQEQAAIASRDTVQASGRWGKKPVVTEILPASRFWPAEECHQQFYEKCAQSYCTCRQVDE